MSAKRETRASETSEMQAQSAKPKGARCEQDASEMPARCERKAQGSEMRARCERDVSAKPEGAKRLSSPAGLAGRLAVG